MSVQDIVRLIERMSDDEKQQLLDYLRQQHESVEMRQASRVFDLHPGAMTMSDDFDAEFLTAH